MRGHLKSACYKRQLDDVNIANACFDISVVRMWGGGGGGGDEMEHMHEEGRANLRHLLSCGFMN